MKIAISAALLAATVLLAPAPAEAASIADLQHLLNNAGYNAGPATGEWPRGRLPPLPRPF